MFQLDRKADSGVIYPSDQEPVAHSQKWHQYPPEIVDISQFVGYVGQILGFVQAESHQSQNTKCRYQQRPWTWKTVAVFTGTCH